MAGEFPAFGEVFVNERDLFLCYSLQMAAMHSSATFAQSNRQTTPLNVVGVMGIGHCAGVKRFWEREGLDREIPKIMIIPKAPLSTRVFKSTVKYGTLGLIGYGIYRLAAPHLRRLF